MVRESESNTETLLYGLCDEISGRIILLNSNCSLLQLLTSVAPNWAINRGEECVTDAKTSLCNIKARGSKRLRVEWPASMTQ
jgi:hypothetical protein